MNLRCIGSITLQTLILFLITTQFSLKADDVYTIVVKKQEDKIKSRWNLTDWLTTRDQMRMQDLWLALHSPSPYEYYVGGSYQFNQNLGGLSFSASEFYAAAFASALGLEARYESGLTQRWLGILDFRFFGAHDQATNLTLQVGLRSEDTGFETYRNPLAGLSLTLYLTRFAGLQGYYRHFFPSTPNLSGIGITGDRLQGGAFLDFRFLRIYGDYFSDVETTFTTTGALVGTKLYF